MDDIREDIMNIVLERSRKADSVVSYEEKEKIHLREKYQCWNK